MRLGILLLLSGFAFNSWAASERPNILLIMSDQQHFHAVGYMDPFFETPHIDKLAGDSMIFSQAFASSPQCSPSRASIYTGLMPHRTGVVGNIGSFYRDNEKVIELSEKLLSAADYFGAAGYSTAYVGKWHLGTRDNHRKRFDFRAFDTVFGGDDTEDAQKTDSALKILDSLKSDSRPFALFVNYKQPHDIYKYGAFNKPASVESIDAKIKLPDSYYDKGTGAKPRHLKRYMEDDSGSYFSGKSEAFWKYYRKYYKDLVAQLDGEVGRLLSGLRDSGLAENTVVLFTSDHGDMDTAHGLVYKGPFMYEELVRVPLLIHLPHAYFEQREVGRSGQLVSGVDLLPTLLDLAGIEVPSGIDGKSLKPMLLGEHMESKRQFIVGEYNGKQRWVHPIRMLRYQDSKYVIHHTCEEEYFDLGADPSETVNLVDEDSHSQSIKTAKKQLVEWMQNTEDFFIDRYGGQCGLQ